MPILVIRGKIVGDLEIEKFPTKADAAVIHLDSVEGPKREWVRAVTSYNVRSEPTTRSGSLSVIGTFKRGDVTEALGFVYAPKSEDVWVRIGYKQYVAYLYRGKYYCEKVEVK